MITKEMPEIRAAINYRSYEWLAEHRPILYTAVQAAVNRGSSPDEIRRFVVGMVGPDRLAIAKRCQQAAEHMREVIEAGS